MVQANNQITQDEIEDFRSDEKMLFAVGNANYNACGKIL